MLVGLPSNEQAADNWLQLREMLLAEGFYPTTLPNFDRVSFRGQLNRFVYEECSFQPDRFDVLGFGPSAISYVADASSRTASRRSTHGERVCRSSRPPIARLGSLFRL